MEETLTPADTTIAAELRAMARGRLQAGEVGQLERRLRQALLLAPASREALNGLAAMRLRSDDAEAAERLLDRASAIAGDDPRVVVNRGLAAADRGILEDGRVTRALAVMPAMMPLLLAQARRQALIEPRMTWMMRATAVEPTWQGLLQLAVAQQARGAPRAAVRSCRQAAALAPGNADALNGLGKVIYDGGDERTGIELFRRAIAGDRNHPASWANMALAQHDGGKLMAAMSAGRRGVALEPSMPDAHGNLGGALLEAISPKAGVAAFWRALALQPGRVEFLSNLLMALSYLDGATGLQAALAIGWWRSRVRSAPPAPRRRHGRMRIGYSSSFSLSSTAHLGLAAIARHDPEAVEVYAYVHRRRGAPEPPLLGPALRAVRDLTHLADAEAAELIKTDRLDLLVDLCGHTPGNRLGVFARKPAPTQATWIESFFTTGLATIDWFITDRCHGAARRGQPFAEKALYLGRPRFCYQPPRDAPEPADPPSRRKGYVTFGCFNYPPKVNAGVLELWADILRASNRARLRLKWWSMTEPGVAAAVRRRFAGLDIDPTRIELSGASSHSAMLAEYGDVDVALDPFPFTGGVTTCEALWMGVPVITMQGWSVIERQSACLLTAIGARDLIARSREEYKRLALAVAEERASGSGRRRSYRDAMNDSPLTDPVDMAHKLEKAYRQAIGEKAGGR